MGSRWAEGSFWMSRDADDNNRKSSYPFVVPWVPDTLWSALCVLLGPAQPGSRGLASGGQGRDWTPVCWLQSQGSWFLVLCKPLPPGQGHGYLRRAPRPSRISPKYHPCCLQAAQRKVQISAFNKGRHQTCATLPVWEHRLLQESDECHEAPPQKTSPTKKQILWRFRDTPENPSKDFRFIVSPLSQKQGVPES